MTRWGWLALAALLGCDPSSLNPPAATDAGKAPDPSAHATPLADLDPSDGGIRITTTRQPDAGRDAGEDAAPPPPEPFDPYESLSGDRIPLRELGGVELRARWVWRDVPGPAGVPQADGEAIQAARELATGRMRILLAGLGRMRIQIDSRAQPLPPGSALLAHAARYGHGIVWPDGLRYRVVAPGALRGVIGEQRADVSPLSRGTITELEPGTRFGRPTQRRDVRSPIGVITLEQLELPEAEAAAPLLCRFLVELVSVDPSSEACAGAGVVVAAEVRWTLRDQDAPGIHFEVDDIVKRADLPAEALMLPPPRAAHVTSGLPAIAGGLFYDAAELARFRREASAEPSPPDPSAPKEGLAAHNRSDALLWLLLDGVPVATVDPWQERRIPGPRAGRYSVQWRSFLGEIVDAVSEKDLPARVVYGQLEEAPDGGAP